MPTAHDMWQRKNCTRIYLRLNNHTDADILEHLQTKESIAGYIKELIRQDILRSKMIAEYLANSSTPTQGWELSNLHRGGTTMIENYMDGERTYRDYYTEHDTESPDWCSPYVKGNNAVCVNAIDTDEVSGLMLEGKDIDFRYDRDAIKRLARLVNPHYADYRGWSDTHIAIEAMDKVGCASCPWFGECWQMDEILE